MKKFLQKINLTVLSRIADIGFKKIRFMNHFPTNLSYLILIQKCQKYGGVEELIPWEQRVALFLCLSRVNCYLLATTRSRNESASQFSNKLMKMRRPSKHNLETTTLSADQTTD